MSESEEFADFRYLFLVRVTDRDLYPGLGEYGLTYSVEGTDEWAPGGMEPLSKVELPRPMDDAEATRWFAESDAALEWLADEVGRETAEQFRAATRDDPYYSELEA